MKDKNLLDTFMNNKRNSLCNKLKLLLPKIKQNEKESEEKFTNLFSKPTLQEIHLFEKPNLYMKAKFIGIAKIRKIILDDSINPDYPILSVKCTCPDYLQTSYCVHCLTILILKDKIKVDTFQENKRKGRKAKVPYAWSSDEEGDQE